MTLTNLSTMSDSLVLFSSDDEESDSHYESKQYENFTAMLKGIPPPSSITISKFTVQEMLEKYQENKESFGFGVGSNNTNLSSSKNPVPFLKYSNSSQISENLASVVQKVQERYVQMETMSSCNIWFKATIESCGSAKKRLRMRQGIGLSPGRRLSHLARRRQFFSSANLQRLANPENIRQIEIKRNSNRGDGRKNVGRTVEPAKLKSSKRALFMSPENETPVKYGNAVAFERKIYSSGSDDRKKLPLQERSKKVEVLKWLSQQNFEVDFPRKRLREECANHSVERKRKCPRRSLNFADDDVSSNVATSDSNNSTDRKISGSGKLSEIHKNKLLWAISVVLRENDITQKDENFKSLAAKLFFTCRTNLDEILNLNIAEGTSDKILYYARKIIPSVFEELGIKSKFSSEDNFKAEKNGVNSKSEITDESKENINRNNVENRDRSSNCPDDGGVEFAFKTPRKIRQKRIVKSCQKAPNSGSKRKKNVMRRWRSLELLIQDAVESSMADLKNNEAILEGKNCAPIDDENNLDANKTDQFIVKNSEISKDNAEICAASDTPLLTSDLIESDDRFCVPTSVIPRLPSVDTSIVFSPIPSSVQEESENILYPSLSINQSNPEESEVLNDETGSLEIINQDEDLKKGIESLQKRGIFSAEYLEKYGTLQEEVNPVVEDNNSVCENPVPFSLIENPQSDNKILESSPQSDANTSLESLPTKSEAHNDDTRTEESLNMTGFSHVGETKIEELIVEESEDEEGENDSDRDAGEKNEAWEPLTPDCISKVEKGTYKPRKLVVKKSKPNWKVVRKNSDEAENESELRLKMRLSHEWEIVCRNSSCSDIGNNSEYETTSMNCSQMSNATDREISSENEVENSSRRSSAQSKFDESMDEELTKSTVLRKSNDTQQIDESNHNINSDLSSREDDQSKCNLTAQNSLIPAVSTQFPKNDNTIQPYEAHNSVHQEKSYDKTGGDGNLSDALNKEVSESNVDKNTKYQRYFIARDESGDSNENENGLCSKINSNDLSMNVMHCTKISTEENCEKEERTHSDKEGSPILLTKRRSGDLSFREGNVNSSPEAGMKEEVYFPTKRSRESDPGQCDSESGNSSASNGPERKKRLLSLENYKARKLEEASNDIKLKVSNEKLELKDISSDEKSSESNIKKKIYNIRLKHPIGHHKHKRKHKHKEYSRERKEKHRSRDRDREIISDSPENVEPEAGESSNSGLQLHSIRQFLDSFCGSDSSGKSELNDRMKRNRRNEDAAGISNSNAKEVNIQTIVDALSALSNLVQEQIKLETEKESGENGLKRSKWLDVVSSWCGRNLSNLKHTSNASSLSMEGLDDGSVAAMKKVLNLGMPQPSESANYGNVNDNKIVNGINAHSINSLKTEGNPAEDCTKPASSGKINLDVSTGYNNATLVNTDMNLSLNSTIPNGLRQFDNDCQTVNFQNYSMYSGNQYIGSQSNGTTFNYTEPFIAFNGIHGVSGVNDFKLYDENTGTFNSEPKVNLEHFESQQKNPKDPRNNRDYWSNSQRLRVDNSDSSYGGSSECSDYGNLNSACPLNSVEYSSSSLQAPYQISNGYLTSTKPSFYQPSLYSNYQNWQMPSDVNSWNYHQNAMGDGYQNAAFYPYQMTNVPYYYNKY